MYTIYSRVFIARRKYLYNRERQEEEDGDGELEKKSGPITLLNTSLLSLLLYLFGTTYGQYTSDRQ